MEKKKTKNAKKWLIPVIVCVLVIASVGGYFLYQKVVNKNNNYGGSNFRTPNQRISPNKTSPRKHKIDTVSIYLFDGLLSVHAMGNMFAKADSTYGFSCNYGIDKDGEVGLYVEERDRAWCNGNSVNDNRAVTIMLASDQNSHKVAEKTYEKLIILMADIAKRNKIEKYIWNDNKEDRLKHTNGANITLHSDFNKRYHDDQYLPMTDIVRLTNRRLGVE